MAKNKSGAPESESDAELVAHLVRLSGRSIRSKKDIADYVDELSRKANERRAKSQHLKNFLLAALFMVAAAQYYFLEVQLEILSQPTLTVFVPLKDAGPQRRYVGG